MWHSHLLPPAYGVWREGNVFSLSVHRGGGQPPRSRSGGPQGQGPWGPLQIKVWVKIRGDTPPPPILNWVGAPPGVLPWTGRHSGGTPSPQMWTKKLDNNFGNFWRRGARAVRLLRSHRRTILWIKFSVLSRENQQTKRSFCTKAHLVLEICLGLLFKPFSRCALI